MSDETIDVVGSLLPVSPLRAAMDAYSVVRAERDEAGKVFTHGDHERGVKAALEAAAPLILAARTCSPPPSRSASPVTSATRATTATAPEAGTPAGCATAAPTADLTGGALAGDEHPHPLVSN